MAKKNRSKSTPADTNPDGISPRAACPCGSGKRYKACHGAPGGAGVFVARPFEGLPNECDLVALRELVPSATVPLTIKGHEDTVVQLGTLLPLAAPAMRRDSGQVWAGLQVQHNFGDVSREVAAVLLKALEATESGIVGLTEAPGEGPRLQDLVADTALSVTVHEGFDWWIADVEDRDGLEGALQQANAAAEERAATLSQINNKASAMDKWKAANQWGLPIPAGVYHLTGRFGDVSGLWATVHTGLDFACPTGTPIHAVAGGTITEIGWAGSYGNRTVETLPDGTELWYAHQVRFGATVGEKVTEGEVIGYVGSTGNTTGPHVHLEVRPGGGDPVDPDTALKAHGIDPDANQ